MALAQPVPRWLLLAALTLGRANGELSLQESAECRRDSSWIALELNGGVAVEVVLLMYAMFVMYVLVEEFYVPALELITSRELSRVPKAVIGCTIMAAGNCLPELSISMVALLSGGEALGTGEVLGSCVFDVLAIVGVVCIRLPREGIRIPLPLMLYFLLWTTGATVTDAALFYSTQANRWRTPPQGPTEPPTQPLEPPSRLLLPRDRHRLWG